MPDGLPPKIQFQRPDEVSDLEWLLLEVERMDCCPLAKRMFMELLRAQAGRVIRFTYKSLVRPDQLQRTRQLLDAGSPLPVVRDAVQDAYGCSTRHAYNLIQEAIHQRGQERAVAMRRAQQDMFAHDVARD